MTKLGDFIDSLCAQCHGTKVAIVTGRPCQWCTKDSAEPGGEKVEVSGSTSPPGGAVLVCKTDGCDRMAAPGGWCLRHQRPQDDAILSSGSPGVFSISGGAPYRPPETWAQVLTTANCEKVDDKLEYRSVLSREPKPTIHYHLDNVPRWTLLIPHGESRFDLNRSEAHPLLYGHVPVELVLVADLFEVPSPSARIWISADGWRSLDLAVAELPTMTNKPIGSPGLEQFEFGLQLINWTLREGESLSLALRADNDAFAFAKGKCPCRSCRTTAACNSGRETFTGRADNSFRR